MAVVTSGCGAAGGADVSSLTVECTVPQGLAGAAVFVGVAAGGGMAGTSVRLVGQDFSLVAALTHATYYRSELWALYNPQQVAPCTLPITFSAAAQHAAGFVVGRGAGVATPIRFGASG